MSEMLPGTEPTRSFFPNHRLSENRRARRRQWEPTWAKGEESDVCEALTAALLHQTQQCSGCFV